MLWEITDECGQYDHKGSCRDLKIAARVVVAEPDINVKNVKRTKL